MAVTPMAATVALGFNFNRVVKSKEYWSQTPAQ
jgi:hypothetical protein